MNVVNEGHAQIPTVSEPGALEVVRLRHYGRWLGAAALLLAISWIVYQLVSNPGFQWRVVGQYLFAPSILAGVGVTLELTFLAMAIGVVLGIILATMELSPNIMLSSSARAYIWFFRGTPVLVQLIFWYNLAVLFPTLSFGIPFGGPKFVEVSANVAISAFTAALLGLGLNEGAYMAEIVRGGILAIEPGQREAAQAIGLTPFQALRHVVMPQAMRGILPPTGNQIIGMLKWTSLASVISVQELLQSAELIYARTFQTIPLLITASIWYLVLTTLFTVGQGYVEHHYSRGATRQRHVGLMARLGGKIWRNG